MYGRQGMNTGEAEFFAPKQQLAQEEEGPSRLAEIKEFNTSFLDSLHSYGDRFVNTLKRLATSIASIHAALRSGKMPATNSQRALLLAVAATVALPLLWAAYAASRRRQRKPVLDRFVPAHPAQWAQRAIVVAQPPGTWPRASL